MPGDDLPPGAGLALIALFLGLQALFAASEIGFLAVTKARVRQMRDSGSWAAALVAILQQYRPVVLTALLIGITGSVYYAERVAANLAIGSLGPQLGPWVSVIGLTAVVLIVAEITPIQFAARSPERAVRFGALPMAVLSVVFLPVALVLSAFSAALSWVLRRGRPEEPAYTEDELKTMIDDMAERGEYLPSQRRMLRGVLDFGDQTAAQVMVPRPDMVAVEADQPLRVAVDLMLQRKHSRLPVYEDTPDDILGILYAKDLLPHVRDGELDQPCRSAARPAYAVPETACVDDLLHHLQASRRVMAIVKDQFGGTAGLITMEDLVEEIVGAILDETDVEEPEVVVVGPGELLCVGTVNLHELSNYLREKLPDDEFDTLSGFVRHLAEGVPEVGAQFPYGDLTLTVMAVHGLRVQRVRIVEAPLPDHDEDVED